MGCKMTLSSDSQDFQPILMLDIEIGNTLHPVPKFDENTQREYTRAQALVRLHSYPIGLIYLEFDDTEISADQLAQSIWKNLKNEINEHLSEDGLATVTGLSSDGLTYKETPKCQQKRADFLQNAPFASIVISTRDRADQLKELIPGLLKLEYPNYEIVIVDNAPKTSATKDLITQDYAHVSNVRYFREDRTGLSWGCNLGLWEAKGDYVVFTDDDVLVDKYWLAESLKGFTLGKNVASVTGAILARELENPTQLMIEQFGGYNKGFKQRIFDLQENRPDNVLYPYSAGIFGAKANMAVKTDIFRSIGGFDPALGLGSLAKSGLELAAFIELITGGYQIVYEPGAIVWHTHFSNYEALKRQIYGYGVGLTALLTRTVVKKPRLLLDIAGKVPYGLIYALNPNSDKNKQKDDTYPQELTRLELQGMFYGPLAYWRSRRNVQRTIKELGMPTYSTQTAQ